MATPSHAQAVKSLNKSQGRRRFVFKTFSQRLEEIDIDVYRLDKVKAEPSEGSTFFRDCLIEWRELNTAEDFISFYVEMMPWVQTLPSVMSQKESIVSNLISRLNMKARLSIEPILRLIAALSRDLLKDFVLFLPRIADSLLSLLECGADREPEIIEQIFTSWSCIMMYLRKYLIRDIAFVLKVTRKLRFYPKDYVQEFMAEAFSFLLRTAADEPLRDGVRRIMIEVVKKPVPNRKFGISALLFYVMIGASSRNHNGQRVYVLYALLHQAKRPQFCTDYELLLEHVGFLMQTFVMLAGTVKAEDHQTEVVDKILDLMLCILNGLYNLNNMSAISRCSLEWAPVFRLKNSSLLAFIRELVQKEPCIIYIFRDNILSSMDNLLETSQEEVLYLLHSFFGIIESEAQGPNFSNATLGDSFPKMQRFLQDAIRYWIGAINDLMHGDPLSTIIQETKLALLWGIISCYPHFVKAMSSDILDLINALDQLLMIEADCIAGLPKQTWEGLIGAALSSYKKSRHGKESGPEETSKFLHLAKRYRSSSQVLSAVADYLDFVYGPTSEADSSNRMYHPELLKERAVDEVTIFADNLGHSNKVIRLSTLRILCHYEPLSYVDSPKDQPVEKKMKAEVSQTSLVDTQCNNGSSSLCVPLVLNGIVGILNNQFSYLWNPALECLAVLLSQHVRLLWDNFVCYIEQYQLIFHTSHELDRGNAELDGKSGDLARRFHAFVTPESDSTPHATALSLLLQSLQKIPNVIESQSCQFIPLLLNFLGYNLDDLGSVGLFNSDACKGKEWKGVLKEWLNLLKMMRNPWSFYQSQFLKEVLQNRLLDENDAEIQLEVLDCLLIWKDDFLLSNAQHLRNLISSKYLREELTTWSLSKESNLIEEQYRAYLLPIVIRLLMPKVRKLKALASRKNASVHQRKAVLGFIAQLDAEELPLFFALLIKPLQIGPTEIESTAFWFKTSPENYMDRFHAFLNYFTVDSITALSWKKIYGFMHVIQDLLGVFDELHIIPFLDLLMGCVVRVLGSCTSRLEGHSSADLTLPEKDGAPASHIPTSSAMKQFKELRSLCLKIVSLALNKYEGIDFGCEFWDLFFAAVKPLVDSFRQEGSSSEKPSSLFSCFVAMSGSHRLVSLLKREKNLVPDIFSILSVMSAPEAIISYVLKFVENLLNLDSEWGDEDGTTKRILLPNLETLICSLHCLFQSDSATKRKLLKCAGERDIRIFQLLSKYVKDPLLARKFVGILLPFISRRAKNFDLCSEAVQVIQDIVPVLGSDNTKEILEAVSPLLASVELEMRQAICNLLDSLAEADASVLFMAKLVHDLNATSAAEIGSLDYDTIVNAHEKICEWIDLLRDMVLKHPEVANLYSLRALCSKDAEVDFFNNIIHLQRHRRARALLRFRNAISTSDMSESCLRLFTVLLRSTGITPSKDQLHLLIQLPLFVEIEKNPSDLALSLLKAIVNRKLVVAEIYDLVTKVGELMVTSQVDSIRKKYEHSTGREAVLEMLHAIIVKFPRENVDEQSQMLFVHFVVCLANDHDNGVRSMTGAVIKKLIGCVSSHSLHSIIEYTLSWYSEETQQLWSAAALVLGLLVEVMKRGFERHVNRVLHVARKILQSAIGVVTSRQLNVAEEPDVAFWREAYYSLVMLEKMLHQFHELCLKSDLEDIWEAICHFKDIRHLMISHLLKRMGKIALQMEPIQGWGHTIDLIRLGGTFLVPPHRPCFRVLCRLV
ncbi:hypothetical protein CJ030_MR7G000028 [Morella rubra]|uniref:U3 small nucleolar RNA-associated protein 20 N-terminal domain-containing protein n=1 Tax=Morella rubra TaxID=262757 RepID=A0A6A1V2N7_9ROSI|nr:hypothetical protein CJ030_MR7G000028 [Morella rubra]